VNCRYYLREVLTTNPIRTVYRTRNFLRRVFLERVQRYRESHVPAFTELVEDVTLTPILSPFPESRLQGAIDRLLLIEDRIMDQRQNLLGSGWLHMGYGHDAPGLEGHVYSPDPLTSDKVEILSLRKVDRPRAELIRSLIHGAYDPIDWQRDHRSGFRWSVSTLSRDIRYGDRAGADVKFPWELGRCHHLVWLALLAASKRTSDPIRSQKQIEQIRNTILDFVSVNPPGFGVQWACTMDVAIRVTNWLVAWDVLKAYGMLEDREFDAAFETSVREHASFILDRLEWNPTLRGNHYLCNLMGLVVCGSYLGDGELAETCLAYGGNLLMQEILLQFHENGGNFEASTSYHRLSGEAALIGVSLLARYGGDRLKASSEKVRATLEGLPGYMCTPLLDACAEEGQLPAVLVDRLIDICAFSRWVTLPDGRDPLIGDNDNGRVLKLDPAFTMTEDGGEEEDFLNHAHLRAGFAGLGLAAAPLPGDGEWLDRELLRQFAGGANVFEGRPGIKADMDLGDMRTFEWPGIVVFRRQKLHLIVRCGVNGQNDFGGHCHNDQLSFVAAFGGATFFVDPGVYVYTPLAEWRHALRNTPAHNTFAPKDGREQNRSGTDSLFRMENDARGVLTSIGPDHVEGCHSGFGGTVSRYISVTEGGVSFIDRCGGGEGAMILSLHLHPAVRIAKVLGDAVVLSRDDTRVMLSCSAGTSAQWLLGEAPYCRAYGIREMAPLITLDWDGMSDLNWSIRLIGS
jgi:hypothetical protein